MLLPIADREERAQAISIKWTFVHTKKGYCTIMAMKLYVGGLPYSTTEDEFKAAFEAHGTVADVAIIKDRDTGQSKGFGFITMDDDDAAKTAIQEMDGSDMGGRTIRVSEARPREERPRNNY